MGIKIALGTVQFGLDYGINNKAGIVQVNEVNKILRFALENGIDTLDTAFAYGSAELVIGQSELRSLFKIVTKLPPEVDSSNYNDLFVRSLDRLQCERIYGLMVHRSSSLLGDDLLWSQMLESKRAGFASKIGFSVYNQSELRELIQEGKKPDIVQIPFNVFDRKFEKQLEELKRVGVEIHTRSTFLQGLFFRDSSDLPITLQPLQKYLLRFSQILKSNQISTSQGCINFVAMNPNVDKVVLGVDSLAQLKENVDDLSVELPKEFHHEISQVIVEEEDLLNPSNW